MNVSKFSIVFLSALFLMGCGFVPMAINSSEGPEWEEDLAERIDESMEGQIKNPNRKIKMVRQGKGMRRSYPPDESDIVEPDKTPRLFVSEPEVPPEWVSQLEAQTTKKRIGKGHAQRKPDTQTVDSTILQGQDGMHESAPGIHSSKLDIVFVVDNSSSMKFFLRNIKNTFRGFISALEPLEWQIMFINANNYKKPIIHLEWNGKVLSKQTYLTKNTEDYQSVFMDTLGLHQDHEYTTGDQSIPPCSRPPYCESESSIFSGQLFERPLTALSSSFQTSSFFRSDANLVAVILSDSDEHINDSEGMRAEDVLDVFQDKWGHEGKRLVVYGIIMTPEKDKKCRKKYSGESIFGVDLAEMIRLTGGTNHSLCDTSYVSLARQIVQGVFN